MSAARDARRACAAALAVMLAGCASIPPTIQTHAVDRAALAAPFVAEGRISARRGSEGVAGQFAWSHEGDRDRIELSSPLGQTIARLEGDGEGVRAAMADGRIESAADWNTLTSRALGLALPVTGLSAWLRGLPREGSPHTLERDDRARTALLTQDGWEIGYGYADAAAQRASRLNLRYATSEPIEVRIVVDRWQ